MSGQHLFGYAIMIVGVIGMWYSLSPSKEQDI